MSMPSKINDVVADNAVTERAVQRGPWRSMAGFSLVELMVGMVISLIGMIVIFQVFAVSENYKRTSVSGSDAQQNGAIALFSLERDIRLSGFGMNDATLLGCTVRAYNENRTPTDFTFSLLPISITQGAGNDAAGNGTASDTISVMYGNSGTGAPSVDIIADAAAAAAVYKVSNRYGFREGDLVVVAEAGKDCTLAQTTGVPGTPGQSDNVVHNSGNYTNTAGANVPAVYNKAGGLGVAYTTSAKMYNLGSAPTRNTYSIVNNSLNLVTDLDGASLDIADNIVSMQAVYCKDLVNAIPSVFTTCNATAPVTWNQVGAVRIGIIARSSKPERECNVTPSSSIPWSGGTFDLSADPQWACFRYKVFQTTVPLRNLIWTP